MNKSHFFSLISCSLFILGWICWIPNLFFYNPNDPPIFIFFTPIIGAIGIFFASKIESTKMKYFLLFLNLTVTFSIGLIFFVGTLFFGP